MKIFLDTSSLFKLYHQELDTIELENKLNSLTLENIFLSEITKIEFESTIWKKVRTKEISEHIARATLILFEEDYKKFDFIATNNSIIEQARKLLSIYGFSGLRTLDSIQLATAISLKNIVEVNFTTDNLLKQLMIKENLQTEIPNL